jgi:hypothetical protein
MYVCISNISITSLIHIPCASPIVSQLHLGTSPRSLVPLVRALEDSGHAEVLQAETGITGGF